MEKQNKDIKAKPAYQVNPNTEALDVYPVFEVKNAEVRQPIRAQGQIFTVQEY